MEETVKISRESYDNLMDIELKKDNKIKELTEQVEALKEGGVLLYLDRGFFAKTEVFTRSETIQAIVEELKTTTEKSRDWLLQRNLWQRIINKKRT